MKNRRDLIFIGVLLVISLIIIMLPNRYKHDTYNNTITSKAKVIKTYNQSLHKSGIIVTGVQMLDVLVLRGKFKGDTIKVINNLTGQMAFDKIFKVGENLLTIINPQKRVGVSAGYYRLDWMVVLSLLFIGFLIFFSGFIGIKTVLSFFFTVLVIWKILVPSLLAGYNPWVVSICLITILDFVIIFLANGFTTVGLITFLGSLSGILFTIFLSIIFGYLFNISGAVKEYSEPLYYNGFIYLNLTNIFLAGIFISASGAIMDITTDIAAAQNEIVLHNDSVSVKKLIKSGFNISKPVLSTMSTTLLFAYAGSSIFLLMLLNSEGYPISVMLNSRPLSAQILQTLVGSFGVILSAPLTSVIGGIILGNYKQKK